MVGVRGPSLGRPSAVEGPCKAALGPAGGPSLCRIGCLLDHRGVFWGHFGTLSGASWAVLELSRRLLQLP
eukprot:4077475-Pyramimonas_sp.AAC.1